MIIETIGLVMCVIIGFVGGYCVGALRGDISEIEKDGETE